MTTNTAHSLNPTATAVVGAAGLLDGKVVFVTGASRGIGAAAARLFAREGAAVVLAARSTDALERQVADIRADGGTADALTVDLADASSIRAAIERVRELHGRLDGAFNNAGIVQQPGPLDITSDADIDAQFTVNFRAHWVAMNAEAALMRSTAAARSSTPPASAPGALTRSCRPTGR